MRLNAKQIAAYTGGQFLVDPIDASALMTGITWDSREVRPGWLYVALPGERVDGHAFVEAALRAGAAGALVTDGPSQSCALLARELGAAIIEVPNTASAITDLARAWRSHLRGRVIGLTGSVGKTTTKNLTRDVCAAYGSVVATKANQNNELGVPRTLLNADPETAVVVVEMGMRGRGQIAELCDFVRPVWGLITNVGESHIELLGSRENIARAKSELFEALPAGVGRAFANLDDDFAAFMAERGRLSERSVALSGFAGHPDAALRGALERESAACDQAVWAEDVSLDAEGRPRFTLCARDAADHDDGALFATVERVPCALSLTGAHNVDNACAAASVALAIEECAGVDAKIKWVNDVFCHGKKGCGILTEAALDLETGGLQYAIVGIGVNLFPPKGGFPPELPEAGAVFPTRPQGLEGRSQLAGSILNHFFSFYPHLKDKPFFADYRRRSLVLGQEITVLEGGQTRTAFALDLERDFSLRVRETDGTIHTLSSGEVRVRPAHG